VSYGLEIGTMDYNLKKKTVKSINGFLKKSCKDIQSSESK
jgi:hypothetical protein